MTDLSRQPSGRDDPSASSRSLEGITILYLVTEDWYFWSHRLPVARAARDAGAKVVVAARINDHKDRIEAEGFQAIDVPFDRSGLNPVRDVKTLAHLVRTYRKIRPDLVHHVAVKPVLYGSIAARLSGVPAVVNAMAGLGFLFISKGRKARMVRVVFQQLIAALGNRANTRLIVQNGDDWKVFEQTGIRPDNIVLIRGSGVDTQTFQAAPEPAGPPVAVCVARMLKDKGIHELVEAARLLKERQVPITIRLVGGTDANPTSIPIEHLNAWAADGTIEYAGHSDDIAGEYSRAHIAVLASYREGLPKSLLEAAACGRPMVATDVPGCREICVDGESGLLVPAQDAAALADALETLARSEELRQTYGAAARHLVERSFSLDIVCTRTLDLYAHMIAQNPGTDSKT